ncbi:MAG: ammonia-dependent NAD(+) synthetase [Pisciglobus halotolerans]|nr:ammonia-dependent NAD(+) synthetase [Pisciglobus halotolerans]
MSTLRDEILTTMKVSSAIDAKKEIENRTLFIKHYLKKHPFIKSVVLGISGGQDSTLVGKLCQIAINEMRAETGEKDYQFIAVRLPYGEQSDESDAMRAIEYIQADKTVQVNIKKSVDSTVETLTDDGILISDFNKGNVKARQRMIVQYAIAGAHDGVVAGSDQSAEAVTGFYTKYGDGGTDIDPIFGLNKRQGRAILKELDCPEDLYTKVPTADLENERPSLPDEEALGVSYKAIDDYLEGKQVSKEDANTIENWYVRSRHKRHMPITPYDTFWK